MKQFVGDLSREDAEIIELYASGSSGVLEFGAGGSTHIIAQSTASGVPFVSLETDQAWIQMTEERLEKIGVREKCKFVLYDDDWRANIVTACGEYSMVFVDGADSLRRQVSVETWPLLNVGGFMLFHDTRRIGDFRKHGFGHANVPKRDRKRFLQPTLQRHQQQRLCHQEKATRAVC